MTEEPKVDEPPPTQPNNFFRFLKYVRPYKYHVLLGIAGGVVKFTVPLLVPEITRHLVDGVYLNADLTTEQKTQEMLLYVGGMMVVFLAIWAPFVFMRHYFASKAGQSSVFDLRRDMYSRILRMSTSFFDRHKSGSIVSRLISDIQLAKNLVGSALTNIWMDGFAVVVILFFLLRIDLKITLVALVTFPVYLYFFRRFRDQIRDTSHQVQEDLAMMSGNVQEKIVGNQVVHAFTQEKNEGRSFKKDSDQLFSTTMRRIQLQSLNMMITGCIVQLAPLIVAMYGGYRVIQGSLSVGELVAVSLYLSPLYTPLRRFSELNVVFSNSMAAMDRVFEIMDEESEVKDAEDALELDQVEGYVAFKDVSFAYKNHDEENPGPVLQALSFKAKPGEKIALVGPSGAGKSTVVSLIPRFYDVDDGAVYIDGYDVREVKVKSLRKHVGMVLQTPILFSGSIWDNVRYGKPDATEEEIVAASKAANAYGFIQELPHGFCTEVGEGGSFLSGGQRQRVTIARAFLKDPKILILDEATSSLDSESEKLIQEALEKLMEGRTTFIIAHRLSTIENADRILVMENGQLVETGTHKYLMHNRGVYERLYKHAS